MGFKTLELVLGADVATAGTVTGIAYPTGTNQAFFTSGNASATGVAIINHNDVYTEAASEISLTYGGSTITLANATGQTWPAGSPVTLQLGYLTSDPVTVLPQAAIADLDGAALSTTNTYTDAAVNAAIDVVGDKLNDVLAALRAAGIIDT